MEYLIICTLICKDEPFVKKKCNTGSLIYFGFYNHMYSDCIIFCIILVCVLITLPRYFKRKEWCYTCYPMILGRVRRNFKHVMLVDVNKVLLLGDPLGRVKNAS